MSFVWGFLIGVICMWLFYKFMFARFFKGNMLADHLRRTSPDTFATIRKAVNDETTRRNSLL